MNRPGQDGLLFAVFLAPQVECGARVIELDQRQQRIVESNPLMLLPLSWHCVKRERLNRDGFLQLQDLAIGRPTLLPEGMPSIEVEDSSTGIELVELVTRLHFPVRELETNTVALHQRTTLSLGSCDRIRMMPFD